MCWAFEGKILKGGKHCLCMSNWSIKHLCGAGGDGALWDGLWLSGFGPSSGNYEGRGEPEVWAPFSQLLSIWVIQTRISWFISAEGWPRKRLKGLCWSLPPWSEPAVVLSAGHLIPAVHTHLVSTWVPRAAFLGLHFPIYRAFVIYFKLFPLQQQHQWESPVCGERLRRVYTSSNTVCIIDNEWTPQTPLCRIIFIISLRLLIGGFECALN